MPQLTTVIGDGNNIMSDHDPGSGFVEVKSVLYTLARTFSRTQQAVDRRNLDLARQFLAFDAIGVSLEENGAAWISDRPNQHPKTGVLPLPSMVSFRRFRIAELLIEFAVTAEDRSSDLPRGGTRFRMVSPDSQTEHAQPARIRVIANERVIAEFQVGGKIKATMALGDDGGV